MKINYLQIEDWCILKDFDIQFEKKISVLIGENGSGKSSVLESIALIFGHLYKYFVENKLNDDFIEGYSIDYNITINKNEHNVVIKSISYQSANEDDGVFKHILMIDGENYTRKEANKKFRDIGGFKAFLPNSIILYYAGISTHILELSDHFSDKYKDKIIRNNSTYTISPYNLPEERLFFHSKKQHLAIILLCAAISENSILMDIVNKIGLNRSDIEVKFAIKKPSWAKNNNSLDFWGSAEGAIKEFLDVLSGKSYQSKYSDNSIILDYVSDLSIIDMLNSFNVKNKELLLFKMLDLLLIDDLLDDINVFWKNKIDNKISIDRLSEGEKQLILTTGLVALWSTENCLILLDEPDTFLHPKWQTEFVNNLSVSLSNQIILTTHSVNLLNRINSSNVQTLQIRNGKINNDIPQKNYGKTVTYINYNLMGVSERPADVQAEIDNLFIEIENSNLKLAKDKYEALTKIIGSRDEVLINAKIEIDFLNSEINGDDK